MEVNNKYKTFCLCLSFTTLIMSCFNNNKNNYLTYHDSLIVKDNIIKTPDFVIYEKGTQTFSNDSTFSNDFFNTKFKVYYDKDYKIKRIIFNDLNAMILHSKDSINNIETQTLNLNPKSIIIDFSDSFKKYKIQYLNSIN